MTWMFSTGQISGTGDLYVQRRASEGGPYLVWDHEVINYNGWIRLPRNSPWYRNRQTVMDSIMRRGTLQGLRRQEMEIILKAEPLGYILNEEFDPSIGDPIFLGIRRSVSVRDPYAPPVQCPFLPNLERISQKYGIRKSVVATVLNLRYEMPPVAYLHRHPEGINSWFLTPAPEESALCAPIFY